MKRYAIIVAGGKGLRMGGEVPKQFLPINGKPVLMRTLEAFRLFDADMQLIVVLPQDQIAYWQELCRQQGCDIRHQIMAGGETRFHSVKNGLSIIPTEEDAVVGVQDGVRPFVSQEVLQRCYEQAEEKKILPAFFTGRKSPVRSCRICTPGSCVIWLWSCRSPTHIMRRRIPSTREETQRS
mgnify:CR=1 FL=1